MSSLSFLGNNTSYLSIPNANGEFNLGTDDFTIEWYQYQTDTNAFPRIFQIGSYGIGDGISIGLSIESGIVYYWANRSATPVYNFNSTSSYKNNWYHYAICRRSSNTKIFINGVAVYTIANDTYNYNSTQNLIISNESNVANNAAFGGYITYFTWVKGTAYYDANFTVSNTYPSINESGEFGEYKLLLTAFTFQGTLGNTVVNHNVTTAPIVPPNFNTPSMSLNVNDIIQFNASKYTNNAMVFYKPGSLASGGVGTVRNSSVKSRRI